MTCGPLPAQVDTTFSHSCICFFSCLQKAQAAQDLVDLFSVIMMSDRNEDNVVTASEADQFMLRIRTFAGKRGKVLNEQVLLDAFRRSMKNVGGKGGSGKLGGGSGSEGTQGQSTSAMFDIVQSALSDDMPEHHMTSGSEANVQSQASSSLPPQTADNDFISLKKIPRVTPTGLVVSQSQEEEGNLAHPIKVEDLMYVPITSKTPVVTRTAAVSTSNPDHENPLAALEDDGGDIVSMLLRSFSGGPMFS